MKNISRKSTDLRQKHNADVIRRMRSGEPLNTVDSKASWFPPRPIIEKDRREMARLYGHETENAARPVAGSENVAHFPETEHDGEKAPLGEAS